MYIYSKLKLITTLCFLLVLVSSCASVNETATVKSGFCKQGAACSLSGELKIKETSRGAVGILTRGEQCIALALSESVLQDKKRWDGKFVVVDGVMYSNDSAAGVVSFVLKDRSVLVGYCSSRQILYLNDIGLQ